MSAHAEHGEASLLSGRTNRRTVVRNAGAVGLTAGLLGLVGRVSSNAAVAAAELVDNAALPLLVPFGVNVRQGPHAGTSYEGFLNLSIAGDGHARGGLLSLDEQAIPVTGQITGQSVSLLFTPAEDQHVYGVGVASEDLVGLHGFNKVAIGGVLAGPGEGDSGDWAVLPPGSIVGKKSPMCKACLQSCRNGFGFGTVTPPEPGVCRDACIQFGDAGYGGCSASDFPPDLAG